MTTHACHRCGYAQPATVCGPCSRYLAWRADGSPMPAPVSRWRVVAWFLWMVLDGGRR
jgi:hypothetical protein